MLDKIRQLIPEQKRETFYRVMTGAVMFLTAFGLVDEQKAALWVQLGTAAITCLFAMLYATTKLRAALYFAVGPLGAVLMAYGLVTDVRWALITAAVGQSLGIATAAAKTVQRGVDDPAGVAQ